jgi:oxalate decarboxylase/phosphoglucose isomerase-like protein (cupin superfamily)
MDDEQLNFERGQRAKRLLEDDLLVEMLKKVEDDCYREIRATKLMEKEVREQAYLLLTTVDILRSKLRAVYDTGVMAEVSMKRRGRPPKVVV